MYASDTNTTFAASNYNLTDIETQITGELKHIFSGLMPMLQELSLWSLARDKD